MDYCTYPSYVHKCSLAREMYVAEGSREDWKKLACFHYRNHNVPMARKIFKLVRRNAAGEEELVGVIVYRYAPSLLFGRSKVFDGKIPYWALNDILSNIARVVIHPKYRTIGLGAKLVEETLPLAGTPYVETSAVMARYNPFFEKAGMTRICEKKPDKKTQECVRRLTALGFVPELMSSTRSNLKILASMKEEDIERVRDSLIDLGNTILGKNLLPKRPRPMFLRKSESVALIKKANLEQLANLLHTLATIAQIKVYLFWHAFKDIRFLECEKL